MYVLCSTIQCSSHRGDKATAPFAYTSINEWSYPQQIHHCSVRVCIYNEHNIGTNTQQFVALSFSICTILGANTTVDGTVVLIQYD